MPTPSRGADTNRPDTSPKAVAALLRRGAIWLQTPAKADMTLEADMLALADALEQQAVSGPSFRGALTQDDWAHRVRQATPAYSHDLVDLPWTTESEFDAHKGALAAALRAAFPELVPDR